MTYSFDLSPTHLCTEPELLAAVPYDLAMYYLALPIGRENDQVSVAMAYPGNHTALATLGGMLHAEIVPVSVPEDAVRSAIQRCYSLDQPHASGILAWTDDETWSEPVTTAAAHFADHLGDAIPVHTHAHTGLGSALAATQGNSYQLMVTHVATGDALDLLLERAGIPLLLVRGDHTCLRTVVIVSRGYASDERSLAWVTQLADHTPLTVTLMMSVQQPQVDLQALLCQDGRVKRHVDRCVRQLDRAGIQTQVKLRQGPLHEQVVEEAVHGNYDLLVLAAEGQGRFVASVLAALESNQAHHGRPILILKPRSGLWQG